MSEYLKCDATGCDHLEIVEKIGPDLIGRPCPKCGSNLLTEADCSAWMAHFQPVIAVLKDTGLFADRGQSDSCGFRVGLHDGTVTAKILPPTTPAPRGEQEE